jgi:cell division protein FtsQ
VHFGDSDFLARYRSYQQHLAEWRQQYPHLASVDMRYENQVVLDMTQQPTAQSAPDASATQHHTQNPPTKHPAGKPAAKSPKAAKAKG